MDDDRVWSFEKSLWIGDEANYRKLVDDECLMVLPHPPFVLSGAQVVEAVINTPRWTDVTLANGQIARPQEGLIVIAYQAKAARGEETYEAFSTSTLRRLAHDEWRVVQHQQTLGLAVPGTTHQG